MAKSNKDKAAKKQKDRQDKEVTPPPETPVRTSKGSKSKKKVRADSDESASDDGKANPFLAQVINQANKVPAMDLVTGKTKDKSGSKDSSSSKDSSKQPMPSTPAPVSAPMNYSKLDIAFAALLRAQVPELTERDALDIAFGTETPSKRAGIANFATTGVLKRAAPSQDDNPPKRPKVKKMKMSDVSSNEATADDELMLNTTVARLLRKHPMTDTVYTTVLMKFGANIQNDPQRLIKAIAMTLKKDPPTGKPFWGKVSDEEIQEAVVYFGKLKRTDEDFKLRSKFSRAMSQAKHNVVKSVRRQMPMFSVLPGNVRILDRDVPGEFTSRWAFWQSLMDIIDLAPGMSGGSRAFRDPETGHPFGNPALLDLLLALDEVRNRANDMDITFKTIDDVLKDSPQFVRFIIYIIEACLSDRTAAQAENGLPVWSPFSKEGGIPKDWHGLANPRSFEAAINNWKTFKAQEEARLKEAEAEQQDSEINAQKSPHTPEPPPAPKSPLAANTEHEH